MPPVAGQHPAGSAAMWPRAGQRPAGFEGIPPAGPRSALTTSIAFAEVTGTGDVHCSGTVLLLTPDGEERVHHLPLELVRRDIAGDHPGVPLMLRVRVLRGEEAVAGAVLDVRHWDALGRTEVRGAQLTDKQGYAEFRTVHPGWRADEPVHIVAAVHVGGYLAGGRSVAHTGFLYFPEALTASIARLAPYRGIRTPRAVHREPGMHVVPRDRFDLAAGLLASIVVAVTG